VLFVGFRINRERERERERVPGLRFLIVGGVIGMASEYCTVYQLKTV